MSGKAQQEQVKTLAKHFLMFIFFQTKNSVKLGVKWRGLGVRRSIEKVVGVTDREALSSLLQVAAACQGRCGGEREWLR